MSKVDGPGIAAIGVGIVFLYGGVKGYSPLVAFQNLIQGKNPNEGQNNAALTNPNSPSSQFGGGTFTGTVSASGNQKLAQQIAIQLGHGDWTTGKIWSDWVALWNGESGWSEKALNPSSGATGIPQALPGNKMASEGADWKTNPATQIRWGIKYIASTYGNPSNAYAKWLSRNPHWY
jgi:hypothetical protein